MTAVIGDRTGIRTGRFRPTRAGVINLWDYRDEEFVFAEGRLVLRGPNGSGKTKALEVLFPFVLDGRIEPRRLNPFAGEDRTMKSNLLYRRQQSSYGYVWMEFARPVTDEHPADTVTVGIGLQAQRHSDRVKRWCFLVDGRVGVDFSLLSGDDRPLTRKQLVEEVGADAVRDSPSEHRAAVDARLFGLGRERYEQLLSLVLTLRRPQLAKNLDPVKLSDTLSDGLRPLDDHLLVEAARSFDDMEAVQRTLDGLVAADEAARTFLTAYTTYLRTHARAAADALSRRRADVATRRDALLAALTHRREAETSRETAAQRVHDAELSAGRLRAHLDRLKSSTAYQAHEQLVDLHRLVGQLETAAGGAKDRLAKRRAATERCAADVRTAEAALRELDAELTRTAATLSADAADAGIGWSADDAAEDGFTDRVAAGVTARDDDVRAVRTATTELRRAEDSRARAETALQQARSAAEAAEAQEREAADRVDAARSEARQRLAGWADRHAATLTELAVPGLLDALATTLDQVGEPDAADPRTAFSRHTAEAAQARRDELARLRQARADIATEIAELEAERELIAAERDDAPPAWHARPAPREQRAGAPLWRLVRFADGLDEADAAGLEAALQAANLLDAWIHPDDAATTAAMTDGEADGYLVALPVAARPSGDTLATVLVPEQTDDVDPSRVAAVLESVALQETLDAAGAPAVSRGGRFAQGIQLGAFGKQAPEYVGATARARRRRARLEEIDRRIANTSARLDDTDRLISRAITVLDAIDAATTELPRVAGILDALRHHDRAAGVLRARREAVESAQSTLDQAVAEAGAADRALRRTAAERSIAPDAVDATAAAVARFDRTAAQLAGIRREASGARRTVGSERDRLTAAEAEQSEASREADVAELRHAEEAERLATLQQTVGAEADEVLAEVERAQRDIQAAETELSAAHEAKETAAGALAKAEADREASHEALRVALGEERDDAEALAPFAQSDLLALLRCPTGLRWPAQPSDWVAPERTCEAVMAGHDGDSGLPQPVIALHDAVLAATRDLTPSEASVKQSSTRLTRALDELQAQLSAAGHDYRPEWDSAEGIIVVRVADEQGFAPVGAFADRIAEARRDQEQLLTDSERRILEDALLTQLARQLHERTVDARDLIGRMNTEMRGRAMSSGLTVGVRWELADSLDEEHRGVARLLDRDADGLGPDELARMRAHFASRIKAARAAKPDRAYRELLGEVLDYRRWRSFSFFLHPPGGGEERLTRARHGQLSGGEQSVSLHLPLFAAAHTMLNSADPHCPRLLALDEAFAGVDDKGRTELFGLSAEFDFDLCMTGYDLWATYDTVTAAAHYDLSHSPAEHTVSALLMLWEGGQRAELTADLDGDLAAALGSPQTRRRARRGTGLLDDPEPEADDGLFDDGPSDDTGEPGQR